LTSAILFAFYATSTTASVLEEWRVGSLADLNKHILCEQRWRGDTQASQKASQEVRWLQVTLLLLGGDPLEYLHHVRRGMREWGTPTISLTRPADIKGGKVDVVSPLLQILHIEEGALPLLARLFPF
jgi:hypothetical protein